MNAILEADETGALTLPSSMLPDSKPHQRYRIDVEGRSITVTEQTPERRVISQAEREEWIQELAERRRRSATGIPGTPLSVIIDELRAEHGE